MSGTSVLRWGIKESLLAYIDRIEDGVIETSAGAGLSYGTFTFEFDEATSTYDATAETGMLQFRGSVIITGHWGAMRVEIHDPQLHIDGTTGSLSTRTNSPISAERFEVFASLSEVTTSPTLSAHVNLAAAGRMMLGQQYSVGQELDALTVVWS